MVSFVNLQPILVAYIAYVVGGFFPMRDNEFEKTKWGSGFCSRISLNFYRSAVSHRPFVSLTMPLWKRTKSEVCRCGP